MPLAITLACFPGLAFAQTGGEGAAPVEVVSTPNVVVLGFADTSPEDCDPKVARYGRCVEDVRFMDMRAAWDPKLTPEQLQQIEWVNTSTLYAEMWEDLAHRWPVGSDPITEALVAKGITELPPAKQQWEATARDPALTDRAIYSLPRSSSWLGAQAWIDPRAWVDASTLTQSELQAPSSAFFPAVRFDKAKGLVPSAPVVVLKGRFAQRLAADNRLHPYDIMDGDPETSAPLFEQMYPYQRAYAEDEEAALTEAGRTQIPLSLFRVDDPLKFRPPTVDALVAQRAKTYGATLLPSDGTLSEMKAFSADQFATFYDLIGTQILRFAREEYTPTHIRVLTALMAMESPPGGDSDGYLSGANVVAAAPGQMDTVDPATTEFRGFSSSRDGFAINTVQLPDDLVKKHILEMEEWKQPSEEFLDELFVALVDGLRDHLSDNLINTYDQNPAVRGRRGSVSSADVLPWVRSKMARYRLRGTDDATIAAWIQEFSFEGRIPVVTRLFKRVALDLLLARKQPTDREQIETRILLDHLNFEIKRSFGGADSPMVTPGDAEARAAAKWKTVLAAHGMYPEPIQDRQGVVNPLAICTVSDRLAALNEPAFGKVNVDELVVGSASLTSVEELLWEVRERVPFFMMDDPTKTRPEVTRLVNLPGDRAVYRVRWSVWSGWHLMWGVEALGSTPDAPRRIALRTSAVCSDLVLTDPDLVPVLLRAAMLDGEFRPAIPVYDPGDTQKKKKHASNDKAKADADDLIDAVDSERSDVTMVTNAVAGDSQAQVDTARALIGGLAAIRPTSRRLRGVDTSRVLSESVRYVQDLFQAPLRRLAANRPLIAMVFDHGRPDVKQPIWSYKPLTPYAQTQHRYVAEQPDNLPKHDRVRYLRSAGWATEVEPPDQVVPSIPLSPAYIQTELLTTAELKQQWRRRRTTDWYFGGGLGFIPYKRVEYQCSDVVKEKIDIWAGFVEDCTIGGIPTIHAAETQGIHLDLEALNTQWLVQDNRIGIEFGPEVQIDILNRGPSVFKGDTPVFHITNSDDEDIGQPVTMEWAMRFQAGIVVGAHFLPDAFHLWRKESRRYPWGAPLPDGSSSLGRFEWGIRGGLLLGPTPDGLESTALGEWWGGWSIRSAGPQASFTAYHPNVLIGPFVRGQVGFPLAPNEKNYLRLNYSGSLVVGVRAQFRLAQQPEFKVEAPK